MRSVSICGVSDIHGFINAGSDIMLWIGVGNKESLFYVKVFCLNDNAISCTIFGSLAK
jgi:hypothetical protein